MLTMQGQSEAAPRRASGGSTAAAPVRLPRPRWLASDAWRFTIAFSLALLIATPSAVASDPSQPDTLESLTLYYVVWSSVLFISYPLLTHHYFRRLSRSQLVAVARREPKRHWLMRYLVTGGGAADWGGTVTTLSLGVVVLVLVRKDLQTPLMLALCVVLVVSGWFMMLYTYALEYLRRDLRQPGLQFPGNESVTWFDYLYFAQQVQTTYAGSDVTILTTEMRKRVNVHNLISFGYATIVVALLVSALLTLTGR